MGRNITVIWPQILSQNKREAMSYSFALVKMNLPKRYVVKLPENSIFSIILSLILLENSVPTSQKRVQNYSSQKEVG
jgi:hypothetical protein